METYQWYVTCRTNDRLRDVPSPVEPKKTQWDCTMATNAHDDDSVSVHCDARGPVSAGVKSWLTDAAEVGLGMRAIFRDTTKAVASS